MHGSAIGGRFLLLLCTWSIQHLGNLLWLADLGCVVSVHWKETGKLQMVFRVIYRNSQAGEKDDLL